MARMSLELSDGLAELRRYWDAYTHEALVLEPDDARIYVKILRLLYQHARNLENEISRHRWNEAAREEAEARTVLAELDRPDTNIKLFQPRERPFGGYPDGGAA